MINYCIAGGCIGVAMALMGGGLEAVIATVLLLIAIVLISTEERNFND